MYYRTLNSPLGNIYLVGHEHQLTNIYMSDDISNVTNLNVSNEIFTKEYQQLNLYFAGALKTFTVSINLVGTDFQIKVWQAIAQIPYGKTLSYQELAIKIGRVKAYRAVANACGANNFPIIIPCHRVVGSNGKLGGFSSGISHKKILLKLEQDNETIKS